MVVILYGMRWLKSSFRDKTRVRVGFNAPHHPPTRRACKMACGGSGFHTAARLLRKWASTRESGFCLPDTPPFTQPSFAGRYALA